jgi:hypothetical protein
MGKKTIVAILALSLLIYAPAIASQHADIPTLLTGADFTWEDFDPGVVELVMYE